MTDKDFQKALNQLARETNLLKNNITKLTKSVKRERQSRSNNLFNKVIADTKSIKALYEKIQTWAYWNQGKINQDEWKLFTKEFDGFFYKLEFTIEKILARNEVKVSGNS